MEPTHTITVRREPGPLVRSLVALVLRLALGLMFLIFGLAKFQGMKSGKYPAMIVDSFAKSPLPPASVKLFAAVLPYAEVGLGIALVCGLLTILAATLSATLLLLLLFGKLVLNDIPAVPGLFTYLLVNSAMIWLSPVTSNYFSLDGLIFGWFWTPPHEARYPPPAPAEPPPKPQPQAQTPPPPRPRPDDTKGLFVS